MEKTVNIPQMRHLLEDSRFTIIGITLPAINIPRILACYITPRDWHDKCFIIGQTIKQEEVK